MSATDTSGHTVLHAIEIFEQLGLSATELKLLSILESREAECIHLLADDVDRSQALVSRAVEELVEKRLTERVEDPADRRRKLVSITPEGRRTVREFARALAAH